MTAVMDPIVIGMGEFEYHSHPALSSTEVRLILQPGGPARYRYAKDNPPLVAPSKKFDLGSAVHSKVLGTGYETAVIPPELLAKNGAISTAAAKEFVEEARAKGLVPLKEEEFRPINAQAESVLAHPTARALFHQPGHAEASVFATDPETGVQLRARFDFLPDLTLDRPVAVDLKTTAGQATPEDFGKAAVRYGYDVQEEHYLDDLDLSGAAGNKPQFAFVAVEKTPPYLTAVLQLPEQLRQRGRKRARRGRATYAECIRTGVWPGLPDGAQFVDIPNFIFYEEDDQ